MIGVVLDLLLAAMLGGAMFFGVRLNARLKSLRDSQAGFAAAAMELNGAIARAEAGLAEMRAASREAEQGLMERVDEARLMVKRLHEIMERAKLLPRLAEYGGGGDRRRAVVGGGEPPSKAPGLRLAPSVSGSSAAATSPTVFPVGEEKIASLHASRSRARIDDELFAEDETVPQMLQRLRAGGMR